MSVHTVAVLALQGGVSEHATLLEQLGAEIVLARTVKDLIGPDGPRVDALVLPGGESSTQDRLMRLFGIDRAIHQLIGAGVPVLGTCAGLIALATEVVDPAPGQQSLGVLDVSVRRNAFGAQINSIEAEFMVQAHGVFGLGENGAVRGALIRAPEIVQIGSSARSIVSVGGRILGVTSTTDAFGMHERSATEMATFGDKLGQITGISFHPELSGEPAFHRALLAYSG